MLLRSFLLAMLVACVAEVSAQSVLQRTLNNDTMPNLVPNPGFEVTKKVQCAWTQQSRKFNEEVMVDWMSPTETTPDLFSTNADPTCWSNPAKRTNGKALPHTGTNMCGIKVYGKGNTPTYWHEYLQIALPEPLHAGTRYVVECWTMRAPFCNEASNNIGIVLNDVPVKTRDCLPLYITPQVNAEKMVKSGWHKVSGVIEATGSERYLLIGNFYGDEATVHERQPEGERGAYYFIDDVNVRLAPPGTDLTPKPKTSVPPPPKIKAEDHASSAKVDILNVEPAVGTRIRLDNIFFDFDKATLKTESEAEIEKVVDLLTDYPYLRIEIEAHTDDQGSDAYNLKLSEDRAKAVVDALVKEKIELERLAWKGYGETKPLTPNTTEEGRAKNRRVEFRVVER
jgi:outer membrane protein OmpA-like peptidoglycan-associated protein